VGTPGFREEEFNEAILERFEIARRAWSRVARYGCSLSVQVFVTTLTDPNPLSLETVAKLDRLCVALKEVLPGVDSVSAEFIGASEIVRRQRLRPPVEFRLPYHKCFTSESGHVALVRLSDYVAFVQDGSGRVRNSLLEDNVRDFQGMVEVNSGIRRSLESPGEPPFWWLNNGVTIVCQRVTLDGEDFVMIEPRVVNGLQTTRVVHDYLSSRPDDPAGSQLIQVRILSTSSDPRRDAVIRATNSQTPVDSASLRATDEIQRSIELYFRAHGLYYDRRKGSYRDASVDVNNIVSIRDLGQALTTLVLGRPDEARGKPSSLLKDQARYDSIFNSASGLDLYEFIAKALRAVTIGLSSERSPVTSVQRRYTRYHVLAAAVALRLGHWSTGRGRLRELVTAGWVPDEEEVVSAAATVMLLIGQYMHVNASTLEKATKAQGFTTHMGSFDWRAAKEEVEASRSNQTIKERAGARMD
jgi:hypothetical protein